MRRLTLALAGALALYSTPAVTAKPQPPGTATPEVAVVRISGGSRRFYELRLSNEDGTGASTLYSSRDTGQMMVDLGPRADRKLLLVQGGRLSLLSYDITSTGAEMTNLEQIVDMGHAGAATATYSPAGTHIAYVRNGNSTIWQYDLATKAHTLVIDLPNLVGGLTFSRDGSTLFYLEQVGPEEFSVNSIPLAGGAPTEIGPRGYFTEIAAMRTSDDLILVDITNWPQPDIYRYTNGSLQRLTNGYVPSFKCDDTTMIFQRINPDSSVSILKYPMGPGGESVFSTRSLYWPEYFPTC